MAARFTDGARLDVIKRDTLFRDDFLRVGAVANYDVFPDGKSFVMLRRTGSATNDVAPLIVLMNWRPRAAGATTEGDR